jgi:hypothetical protein
MHCINGRHGCYDVARAKDFLRSYACSFYGLLKDAYSQRIFIHEWEQDIAEEAIQITLACWANFNVSPRAESWAEILHSAIVQHVGHPLRGQMPHMPVASVAQRPISTPSSSQSAEVHGGEVERRQKLLSEYKAATGNPSNKKIYEAKNSGIHKPEFYQWRAGRLSVDSRTTKTFEAFLRAKRRPIPRNPTG